MHGEVSRLRDALAAAEGEAAARRAEAEDAGRQLAELRAAAERAQGEVAALRDLEAANLAKLRKSSGRRGSGASSTAKR